MKLFYQKPLKRLTSFKQAGYSGQLYEFEDVDTLSSILPLLPEYTILGAGSNILFDTQKPLLPIIKLSPSFGFVQKQNDTYIRLPGGLSIRDALKITAKHHLSGLEFAAGVPASIGGMIAMNFGCWGYEIADYVNQVHVMYPNGHSEWISKKACHFQYRRSALLDQKWLCLDIEFRLKKSKQALSQDLIKTFLKKRQASQPLNLCSFGSIFKNPTPLKAGEILDQCDAKSLSKGSISVSQKHANFLVNQMPGEASFQDALSLINTLQKKAYHYAKTKLELEVQII